MFRAYALVATFLLLASGLHAGGGYEDSKCVPADMISQSYRTVEGEVVSIETGDHSQEWLSRFAEMVGAMPEVMEFYRMAGDVDYMLRVAVSSIQDYDGFYKRLIAAIPLKNVTSRFAMERIKATTALPIT